MVAVSYLGSCSSNAENVLSVPDSSPGGSWNDVRDLLFRIKSLEITKAIITKGLQGSLFGRVVDKKGKV